MHWQSQEKSGMHQRRRPPLPLQTFRPLEGMRAASPRRRFQQPPAHSRKIVLEVSSEPWSGRSGRSSHGPWFRLPAEPSPRPPPQPRHATPRHQAPPTAPAGRSRGLGYPLRFSKQDAEGAGSGSKWICSRSLSEPPPHICFDSPSSARYCSV